MIITIYRATKDMTTAEFLTEAEALAFSRNVEVIEREVASPEEIARLEAARIARKKTLDEIARLEALADSPRRRRDALLTEEGKAFIQDIEDQINNQRSKL